MLENTIESVVQEYFSLNTKESCMKLESLFQTVKQSKDKWSMATYLLQNHSGSLHILWFTLTLYEDMLSTGGGSLLPLSSPTNASPRPSSNDKYALLFQELRSLLESKYLLYPPHIQSKMLKLFSNLLIFYDPPWQWDTFQYLASMTNSNPLLAFSILRVYSEELTLHSHLTYLEKKKKNFICVLPSYFEFVFKFMAQIPTWSSNSLPPTPVSPTNPASFSSPTFDSTSIQACKILLETLHHLLTTIPTLEYMSAQLLDVLFQYAMLSSHPYYELQVASMGCISEAMGKQSLLVHIHDYNSKLIPRISALISQCFTKNEHNKTILISMNDDYRTKLFEALTHFFQIQFSRVWIPYFSDTMDLLSLMFRFTFLQDSISNMIPCLDMWSAFIDIVNVFQSSDESNMTDTKDISSTCREGLMSFSNELIKRVGSDIEDGKEIDLSPDSLNDEELMNDWHRYLHSCSDVLSKTANVFPNESLEVLFPMIVSNTNSFQDIGTFMKGKERNLQRSDIEKLREVSEKFCFIIRVFGFLSELFTEQFEARFNMSYEVVTRCINSIHCCVKDSIYQYDSSIANICTQLLSTTQLYIHWIAAVGSQTRNSPQLASVYQEMYLGLVKSVIPLLNRNTPSETVAAAASLLNSIITTLKPNQFLDLPVVSEYLKTSLHEECFFLPNNAKCLIYQSFATAMIQPVASHKQDKAVLMNDLQQKAELFKERMKGITLPYEEFLHHPQFKDVYRLPEARQRVLHFLCIYNALMQNVRFDQTHSKLIIYQCLQSTLNATLLYFQAYVHDSEILISVIDFFSVTFDAMQKIIDSVYISECANLVLRLLSGEELGIILSREDAERAEVLHKILLLLTNLIHDSTDKQASSFLPEVIQFSVQRIFPEMQKNSYTLSTLHILPAFYSLLSCVVINHWRYFFPISNVHRMTRESSPLSPVSPITPLSPIPPETQKLRENQFLDILKIFESGLGHSDIQCFKHVLSHLQHMGTVCRLFYNNIFQEHMRHPFLERLLNVLTSKSQNISREEIINLVMDIASANFEQFYFFAPLYIDSNCTQLLPQHKMILLNHLLEIKDTHSGIQKLNQYLGDHAQFCREAILD